ncbi:MAG: ATP-binding protein [Pseudomonadota bacterium]|nr:ATP-binding protein [Pseudomonadota bacterium]
MSTHHVEVQQDFVEKITHAKPVLALAEMIWNALDADAIDVGVTFEYDALDSMSAIVVADNGTGIAYDRAPDLFKRLGGSWKRSAARTSQGNRYLHGQDGRGRFKAFALGRVADWKVAYKKGSEIWTFTIHMTASDPTKVIISDESRAGTDAAIGVTLRITEPHKDYRALTSEAGLQELTEVFALYLTDYQRVTVRVDGHKLDPSSAIVGRRSVDLTNIVERDESFPARLEIIEWRSMANRALYLCSETGFPLLEVDRRFHIGAFQFSAYLRSRFITKIHAEDALGLAQMNPVIIAALDEAQQTIKDYFRGRAAEEARSIVDEWIAEKVYPFEGTATSPVERVERQVFDIVAANVAQYVPDVRSGSSNSKALHLRLLRNAIEKSPEELQFILDQVLKLPKRKQQELATLLRNVSLSSIISAAKIVADRLKFLAGLEAILFDTVHKQRLKERSQLHKIIADNCWLFGEEYGLSVNDRSLTEVLRQHRAQLGGDVIIDDEPVKHVTQERGIVDLMLSRAIRQHRANNLTHLVVELKAPKVKIDSKEITQVEGYAFSVARDERFRGVNTEWSFWALSDDYGDFAAQKILDSSGLIYQKGGIKIFVKSWAQVLDDNRSRLQFFQEKLEYQANKEEAFEFLQERYSTFMKGVVDPADDVDGDDQSAETA